LAARGGEALASKFGHAQNGAIPPPREAQMADIFVSYTSSDKDWAFWIAKELRALGHEPHVHEWEIEKGESIYAWMERVHHKAEHVLCVISDDYLNREKAPYSALERDAALWQTVNKRPCFALMVVVKPTTVPTLSDHFRRCELFDKPENQARQDFRAFMEKRNEPPSVRFPGSVFAHSNITISVPEHFLGRDADMAVVEAALARYEGRVAITALHGLRGVGKTTLAAAYAEKHKSDCRATWWLRAQSESTLRADLVGLGVRLNWVAPDAKEEAAVGAVLERLRHEGGGILLIYDNALHADSLRPFLPVGGAAKILVTSNAHNWRKVAAPVEIKLWPKEIGADFLIARTGRTEQRAAAEALSHALHGLPLAHEQAAAYCEDLNVGFADYLKRFEAEPLELLAEEEYAPQEHNDRQTVAKSFALGIDKANERHPAAEALILYAAQLAAEPIPLYFFIEGGKELGEPFASLTEAELDKAIAALRRFALVDVDEIKDERDPEIKTKTLRLHRLVRFVAGARLKREAFDAARRRLTWAMWRVYPEDVHDNPRTWPRARLLDELTLELVDADESLSGIEEAVSWLRDHLAAFRISALGAYGAACQQMEKSLLLSETHFGCNHPETARRLSNFALVLGKLGGSNNYERAKNYLERALRIQEREFGHDHPALTITLSNLAETLRVIGGVENLSFAEAYLRRALAIDEQALGMDHPNVAFRLTNLGAVLRNLGGTDNFTAAKNHFVRALTIFEKVYGWEHQFVAINLLNLGLLLQDIGGPENLESAEAHFIGALAIDENVCGPEHPDVGRDHHELAKFLTKLGGTKNIVRAREHHVRAETILRQALGDEHLLAQTVADDFARFRAKHGQG
jgi:tetratricopeptide (TPR) repeat protein